MDTTSNTDANSASTLESLTNENPVYSNMVGVFRDRTQAEQAVEALKQAGIADEEPELEEYGLHPEEGVVDSTRSESDRRYIVRVLAKGKEQDAVEILIRNGANNSDLPPGTALVRGSLVNTSEAIADHAPVNPAAGTTASNSLYEGAKAPGPGHLSDVNVSNQSGSSST